MNVLAVLAVLAGLLLLWKAADVLVDAASVGAARIGVPPLVVGAVVVGAGTSSPEAFVSALAALEGRLDVATANVVGSNAANLSLVLGSAALLRAVPVSRDLLRGQLPLTVVVTAVLAVVVQGGLSRVEGLLLLGGLVVLLALVLLRGRGPGAGGRAAPDAGAASGGRSPGRWALVLRVVGGLVGVVAGAQLLVTGASDLAADLGASPAFVGLTVVAVGTSLPELVTSVAAARRGATDLLLGNVLGSNVVNSLGVMGLAAVLGPGPLEDTGLLVVGVATMLVVTALATVFLLTSRTVSRREGAALLAVWLVLLPFAA